MSFEKIFASKMEALIHGDFDYILQQIIWLLSSGC